MASLNASTSQLASGAEAGVLTFSEPLSRTRGGTILMVELAALVDLLFCLVLGVRGSWERHDGARAR